jgi:hypothetical protein
MTTKGLRISPDLSLPLDAVTETFAILAKRRAGKSNAAVVMAEEMYDHGLPWVAIDPKGDWWGVRAAGDGKAPGLSVLVFGGLHGDVPLEPTAGELVADLIVGQRLTCVLDVSEMTKADQRRFLTAFADRLYRKNTEPLHVFCEEADEYIPQRVGKDNTKMVGVFETLVKRGGFRGIGITLITQRSASLNKDVLTQIETLIPMRTPSPQDRKAVLAWVEYHEAGAEAVAELPGLADGEAWVFSPQWLSTLVKIKFRRRRTFDSGATPKVGGKPRPPATLAEVDLDSIKVAMAETIEKAQADDPKHLRREVARLEKALAHAEKAAPEPVVETVEVPVLHQDTVRQIEATFDRVSLAYTEWAEQLAESAALTNDVLEGVRTIQAALHKAGQRPPPAAHPRGPVPTRRRREPTVPLDLPSPRQSTLTHDDGGEVRLRKGAVRMVEALGRMAPLRLSKGQWGTVARLKTTGGTWSTYLGEIRRLGLIDENAQGFTLTDAGFDYIGGKPAPMTADELQQHYLSVLRAGASKMLKAVIDAHPDGLTRDELGDRAEIVTTGGTFSTYLGELRRNGLVEEVDGMFVATDVLMYGADA